jgi:predicted GH43/DUF377 family glycosyl hydrolase
VHPWMTWLALLSLSCGEPMKAPRAGEGSPIDSGSEDPGSDTDDSGDSGQPSAPAWVMQWAGPDPELPVDECAETCLSVALHFDSLPQAGLEVVFEQEGFGVLGSGVSDADGIATMCVNALAVGMGQVAATLRASDSLVRIYQQMEVRPFGYAYGLDKPFGSLPTLAGVADFERYPDNPVLEQGEEGSWDDRGVIMPSVVHTDEGYFMYFAGAEFGVYSIGVATSEDGLEWTKYHDNPIFGPGGDTHPWRGYATNGPAALEVDGRMQLWLSGRSAEYASMTIGLAESYDGLTFAEHPDNPVFEPDPANADWEGDAVAHPSVTYRDAVYEMWYSTGLHRIGYAISTDGVDWQRYCSGPVMEGDPYSWDLGQVKAAEVVYKDGLYLMTYSGGGSGAFRVGWAISMDGIRWVTAEEPILEPVTESDWESRSVLAAALSMDEGQLRVWYSGTAMRGSSIGVADAPWVAK